MAKNKYKIEIEIDNLDYKTYRAIFRELKPLIEKFRKVEVKKVEI